jgi:hypothetical protein
VSAIEGSAVRRVLARIAEIHRGLAVFLLNTLVVLALVAVVLARWFPPPPVTERLAPEAAAEVVSRFVANGEDAPHRQFFPFLTPEDIAMLHLETLETLALEYEPFTQFRHAPFAGRFVNIDPNGFRRTIDQGPWPPDPRVTNVFVFGGSTTFGTLLTDETTVPSALRRELPKLLGARPVHVYNFGRGYYFSSQERVLFETLLVAGHVPQVAIFIDGLNDFFFARSGEPGMTEQLRDCVEHKVQAAAHPWRTALEASAMGRAADWCRARAGIAATPTAQVERADATSPSERVIRRYAANSRIIDAIGRAFDIRTVRVWQPVPTYEYDLAYHAFADGGFGANAQTAAGYAEVQRAWAAGRLGSGVVWCAGIQKNLREPLYVDKIHYSPRMARRLAACIVKGMRHEDARATRS